MFSRFDRYVARSFIWPWILCLVSVLGLYVVIDLFSKLGGFREQESLGRSLELAVVYYATFLPLFLSQVMPMVTLLAAMIALIRLSKQNELTALKACGISFQRTLVPLFLLSALLAGLLLVDQEWVVPQLARQMQRLKVRLSGSDKTRLERLYSPDLQGRVFLIEEFYTRDRKAPLRAIYVVSRSEPGQFVYAETGTWVDGDLLLSNVIRSTEPFTTTPRLAPDFAEHQLRLSTSLTPEQLQYNRLNLQFRTIGDLRGIAQLFPHMAQRMLVEVHRRLAFCVANVALLLVAIPFTFQQESRSALVAVGIALLVGVGYYFLSAISTYLGMVRDPVLPPAVAGWLPVLASGGLGLYLFRTMPT
ncbi:MAG: LptF/LptG family permease [Thermoleophilia bacterium]|nr:LptF/LptG family permease [Thermoleophilia bacterium]